MTATVAAPQGNQFGVLLAIFLVITFTTVVVYWNHERRMDRGEQVADTHDEQLAGLTYRLESLLEYLGLEVPEPVEDDSPEALQVYGGLAATDKPDEMPTDEIPIAPETVPDGMPLVVQSALIEARDLTNEFPQPESDEAKARKAAWVEEQLREIRARIEAAQGA